MGKDFVKFMVLVIIIYCGFLTTFSLIGRATYTFGEMTWFLTKIFFGSSYVGFDIMTKIDPIFGPPLMVFFVMLSSILLMGSLTGMLSNSFSRVITHAREEYLYVYSVYVLEASTSNRLTHFYPPFNILALVIFRPLRLFLPSDNKFRKARILLLKATHLPIVGAIELYEWARGMAQNGGTQYNGMRGPRHAPVPSTMPPQKKWTHSPVRPGRPGAQQRDSSSSLAPVETLHPAAATASMARLSASRKLAAEEAAAEDQIFEGSDGELRLQVADLSAKIDRLTELVITMQSTQSKSLTDVAVA